MTYLLTNQTGRIKMLFDNIIIADGLGTIFIGEVVKIQSMKSEFTGQVVSLERSQVKITLLSGAQMKLRAGDLVLRTFKTIEVPVGFGTLGRMYSPLGECIDYIEKDKKYRYLMDLVAIQKASIERGAPGIIDRESIRKPFLTGIGIIDAFIPIGCGQRELIIGNNGSGKTSLAITSIINQSRNNNDKYAHWRHLEAKLIVGKHSTFIPCIYVAIGQRRSEIARIKSVLQRKNAFYYTCIVFTSADDPAGLQYIAPYSGCTVGEYFRDAGYNALVVYDELVQHAVAYRQISLLIRRPPGREAYPGDIFYIHSRLLERSAQMSKKRGGGSLTALPIVETKGGDISAYIPTNVISITDGQVYLSEILFNKGLRPGVNLTLSVSRVGSAAQYRSMVFASRIVRKDLVMYKTIMNTSGVNEDDLDAFTARLVLRGRRLDKFLCQRLYDTLGYYDQVIFLYALSTGAADKIDLSLLNSFYNLMFSTKAGSKYLHHQVYPYILHKDRFDSFFQFFSIEHCTDSLNSWSTSYSRYFRRSLQPRLIRDNTGDFLSTMIK